MSASHPTPEFLALIEPHTGPVGDVRPVSRGFSSDVTAVVHGERGRFFVKAVGNRPGGRRDSLVRERLINPAVHPISPPLLWHTQDDTWVVLGFEAVHGRRSDFAPHSPDLPAIVDTLNRIAELDLPDIARDWPETRWNRFTPNEAEAALLQGDALLHTDINPGNIMIGAGRAWAVDWSWPTRGAGFIDPACLVVQLVASGHSARSAETWASECVAWAKADPVAVTAFAAANARMYRAHARRKPDTAWLGAMADAAHTWATHRGVADDGWA